MQSSTSFMCNETLNLVEESQISLNWTTGFKINTFYNRSKDDSISLLQVLLKIHLKVDLKQLKSYFKPIYKTSCQLKGCYQIEGYVNYQK